jgi:hypothetical protein
MMIFCKLIIAAAIIQPAQTQGIGYTSIGVGEGGLVYTSFIPHFMPFPAIVRVLSLLSSYCRMQTAA